ncbi:MAG: FKBP-type peptidyl-prolyl cis-trans isomerase [Bacteroidota bacterium]
MKKSISIIAFFLTLNIYAQKTTAKQGTQASIKLNTQADSLQYVLGSFVGRWIMDNSFVISNQSLFITAMNNIILNRPRAIPDSAIASLLATYQQANQRNRAMSQEQQLFASIKDKTGVGMIPNGVRYIVLKKGNGPRPSESDSIVINMVARLADGTVVEDTYLNKKPFDARTDSFFPGLTEALQMMSEGSKWQLFIPSALAYGDKGTTLIPPNSALVIEAELVSVKPGKK